MLQIFAIIDDTSVMNFRKKLQHNFPKMSGGGGAKGHLELFRKFIRFGRGMRPLVLGEFFDDENHLLVVYFKILLDTLTYCTLSVEFQI